MIVDGFPSLAKSEYVEWVLLILALGACGLLGWQVARALKTGVLAWGAQHYRRDAEASDFWFHTLWLIVGFIVFLTIVVLFFRSGEVPRFRVGALLFTPLLLYWLVQSLRTGVAGFGELRFARDDEKKEYWALVALNIAGLWLVSWGLFRAIVEALTG